MKINPKVTGALAWTGLVLVLAVPAADMLGGKPEAKATLTSDMDQIQTASAKPTKVQPVTTKPAIAPATSDDVVQEFVKSGKPLPSYISGNDAPVTETASVPTTPVKKPGTITINPDGTIDRPTTEPEVATVPKPNLIAPVPLPASARPAPKPSTPLPQTTEAPLILDENAVASTGPLPPEDIGPEDPFIAGDELEEWDSGSLADYLERRGLLSDSSQATAPGPSEYDPDGFFLDEGPNGPRRSRVIIVD